MQRRVLSWRRQGRQRDAEAWAAVAFAAKGAHRHVLGTPDPQRRQQLRRNPAELDLQANVTHLKGPRRPTIGMLLQDA